MKGKTGVKAMAEALANELGQARLLAMRQLSPVAVMFPAEGGRPHSTSLYQLEGLTFPRVTRSRSYAGDFPGQSFFIGSWGASGESSSELVSGTKWTDFDVDEWLPHDTGDVRKDDSALVFMPDGTVRGRRDGSGLPHFQGEYHIAVSAGVSYSNSNLSAAGETFTVCVNGGGGIRVESGLAGSSIKTVGTQGNSHPPAPAVKQTQLGHAMGDPRGSSSLPTATEERPTTIPPDGFATVTAFAQDVNESGERLFCRWKVNPPTGRGDGVFSVRMEDENGNPKGAAMDFNPKAKILQGNSVVEKPVYQASYQWHPPTDAEPGDVFKLNLLLQNQATGQWLDVGIQKIVKIGPYGDILFERINGDGSERGLYRMNADGGNKRRFEIAPSTPAEPKKFREWHPAASADSSRIAFIARAGNGPNDRPGPSGNDIYLTDKSGLTCVRVTQGLDVESVGLSPDGSHVVFKAWEGGSYSLYTAPVYPTNVPPYNNRKLLASNVMGINNTSGLHQVCFREDRLVWTPNNHILYCAPEPRPWLYRIEVNESGAKTGGPFQVNLLEGGTLQGMWSAYWSPRFGQVFSTIDKGIALGDPLIGQGDSSGIGNGFFSEGDWDSQPSTIEYTPGQKGLMWIRTPTGGTSGPEDNLHIVMVKNLPLGTNPIPDPIKLTADLTTGKSWFPIHLR
ncbi:MAG: hypothetical protein KIS61_28055 [Candidatus Eremiobacteraeota bacterium]|nr:hypothetical protein [Candidatus Eremiobacteraeota bacterium]